MKWFEGRKVLVPIDFSEASHGAVDAALDMMPAKGAVSVLHVAADMMVMEPGMIWEEATEAVREKNLQAAYDKEYEDAKYDSVPFHVAFGDAGHEIAKFAEKMDAGLIVMPSHGRTGMTRLLLGSVAERVVRLAHCPVLVLKH